jgi:hypothetical protein
VLSTSLKSLGEGGCYPDASGNSRGAKMNVVSNTIFPCVVLNRSVAQRVQHADSRQHRRKSLARLLLLRDLIDLIINRSDLT